MKVDSFDDFSLKLMTLILWRILLEGIVILMLTMIPMVMLYSCKQILEKWPLLFQKKYKINHFA